MRAALLLDLGRPLEIEDVELRSPEAHEAIVRMQATAVCITDVFSGEGHVMARPPSLLGHAAAGIVEEVGPNVSRVKPGDRVVVCGTPECGLCYWCMRGQPAFCEELPAGLERTIATRRNGELVYADGGIGTFAERLNLREAGLVAVDAEMADEHLCLLGCGAMSGMSAVFNIAGVEAGASMVVVGCGHLGLWMIQAGRVAGAGMIIAVEPRAQRRELAGRLGATHLIDPADGDPIEAVRELTGGRGADYAFEAAGPPEAIEQAFAMTRHAGTFVPAGWSTLSATVTFNAIEFAIGARRILSCQYGGATIRRDIPRFAAMMDAGIVDAAPIVSRTYELEEINDAFAAASAREVLTGVVRPAQ
ncbi:MAG TPA: zinc-binding dehydrogenase [Solirubrobacteraceae bacterium]|nr:zinc-binding dehydrogenase [Solirubrobacteraceae bacterium]